MHVTTADDGTDDGLPRADPAQYGVSSDVLHAFLDDVEQAGLELHGLMIWRDGAIVAEGFHWPYAAHRPRLLHSITKSFAACAAGLLIAEGRLNLTDPICGFFPDMAPQDSSAIARVTVEDLLTMRVGHGAEVSGALWREIETSWIAEFLRIPIVHPPGTVHVYSSAASYMLSAIVSRITGETLHAYLKPRLFAPLGIHGERWDIGPDGINPGGNGITALLADALKLGILHAQQGRWGDVPVLPAAWVAQATQPQGDPHYGYHWVVGDGYFAALGVFVQAVFVYPDQRAVIAVSGAMRESKVLLPHLTAHVPRAFTDAPTPERDDALRARLQAWSAPVPFASHVRPDPAMHGQSRWIATNRNAVVEEILLAITEETVCLTLVRDGIAFGIDMPVGGWRETTVTLPAPELHHGYTLADTPVVAGARWLQPDRLEIVWHFVESAFRDVVTIAFDGPHLTLERKVNINSAARAWPIVSAMRV